MKTVGGLQNLRKDTFPGAETRVLIQKARGNSRHRDACTFSGPAKRRPEYPDPCYRIRYSIYDISVSHKNNILSVKDY